MAKLDFLKPMLRQWLKRKVYDACPMPNDMDLRFEWVYAASITQWHDRLWAIRAAHRNLEGWPCDINTLDSFLRYLNR